MDTRTQDAIERLGARSSDFKLYTAYINERREIHLQALITAATEITALAKSQGVLLGIDEILRIPEDALNEKKQRTES